MIDVENAQGTNTVQWCKKYTMYQTAITNTQTVLISSYQYKRYCTIKKIS